MNSSPSTTMSKGAGLISSQDLLKLIKGNGKSAFLRVKSFSSFTRSVKWRQRFVILANNEIYIYQNELSKKPSSCIPLLGYNKVQRFHAAKFPWSFSIVAAVSSVKTCVFSCATEEERREWMRKTKDHIYKANDVERPFTDELNQLTSGTEQEYIDLEEPVFTPESDIPEKKPGDFSDDNFQEEDDESDEEDLQVVKRTGRKISVGSIKSDRALPPLPSSPPRYSDVIEDMKKKLHTYQNDPELSQEPDANLSTIKLESCLITDPDFERNREKCIEFLRTKSLLGTYLIRKSRQGDNLVLVVLTENKDIKEYRLEENGKMFRLAAKSGDTEFISIDALLRFYSHNVILSGLKHYLTYGVFERSEEEEGVYHGIECT